MSRMAMSEYELSSTCVPACPVDVAACGIPQRVLEDLVLKHLHPRGSAPLEVLSREMRLPVSVMSDLVATLQSQEFVEPARGLSGVGTPTGEPQVNLALTASGRNRACDAFSVSRYLGPAPVCIADYIEQCRKQQLDGTGISQEELYSAMTGVSLDESTLTDLQLALGAGGSLLLTGHSGNGKTLLASRLGQLIEQSSEEVYVPYALWVDEGFLRVFDPSVHRPLDEMSPLDATDWAPTMDARWRRVRRPVITVSTELSRDSFEIRSTSAGCTLVAPFQVLANGGLLVVDDLGRQVAPFADLMNRFLLPLEQKVDSLTLPSGRRLNLPVDAWLVLVAGDDAPALPVPVDRRIKCRLHLPVPDRDRFATLLYEAGRRSRIEVDEAGVEELFTQCYSPQNPPKCSDPQNLLQAVESICRIQKETVRARADLLLSAAKRLGMDRERRAA